MKKTIAQCDVCSASIPYLTHKLYGVEVTKSPEDKDFIGISVHAGSNEEALEQEFHVCGQAHLMDFVTRALDAHINKRR